MRLKEGRRLLGSKLYLLGLEIQISSSHGIVFGIPSGDESTLDFWSGVDSWDEKSRLLVKIFELFQNSSKLFQQPLDQVGTPNVCDRIGSNTMPVAQEHFPLPAEVAI